MGEKGKDGSCRVFNKSENRIVSVFVGNDLELPKWYGEEEEG